MAKDLAAKDGGKKGKRQERKEIDAGVGEDGCGEGGRLSLLHGGSGGDEGWRRKGRRKEAVSYGCRRQQGRRKTGRRRRRKHSHVKEGPMEGDGDFQAMASAENGVEGEGGGRRCWAWTQGRRRRRGRQETVKEGGGGSASAASRGKNRRRKTPRSMAATVSWEGGTGGLMKTETRPTATEKCKGREDPLVVGDGKDEEGERERQRRRRSLPRIWRQHHGGERRWGLR